MLDIHQPFTRAAANADGITDTQLRGPRFRRLFPGTYVDATAAVTPAMTATAALMHFPPDARASHMTAAELCGVVVPASPVTHVSVIGDGGRRRIAGIRCHLAPATQVWRVGAIRVSSPTSLFVELGTCLDLVDHVVAGDHLVRLGLTTAAELVSTARMSRSHGVAAARKAAGFVRAGSESPMETRARLLLALAGFPEPEVNPEVIDAYGHRRRYDLLYRTSRTIVEYDGRQHAENTDQWRSDLQRREALDRAGWRILVLTAEDVYRTPGRTLERIRIALTERGEPGVPLEIAPAWRAHF